MSDPIISQINLYPIKSTAGLSVTRSFVTREGLSFDRRYMVTSPSGEMITARTHPRLLQIRCAPSEAGIVLTCPGFPTMALDTREFSMSPVSTHVFKDQFNALATSDDANAWLSEVLGEPVQLLYLGVQSQRLGGKSGAAISFADGFPLLVISEASLADLNARCSISLEMARFRPNLVVSGVGAFAEDSWQRIRIGDVEFVSGGPCSRCVLTTRDPASGEADSKGEPLRTLATFRRGERGKVNFGTNLMPANGGTVEIRQQVVILETSISER